MIRSRSRFKNHLDDNLVHLHKNMYISQGDPLYYEKVLRYLDPKSPEAHYRLGQKHQLRGNYVKAIFHYKEVLRIYPSSFYSAANRAIHMLENKLEEDGARKSAAPQHGNLGANMPPFLKSLLIVLFLINLMLILMYFAAKPISTTVSTWLAWGVGKQVTYETVDVPYQMYFPQEASKKTIETDLYKQAIELGKMNPEQNVFIYGITSLGSSADGAATIMTNEGLKANAFVVAEYYPTTDHSVRIRFLNPDYAKQLPLTSIGTNLVRTAIYSYLDDHGYAPATLDALVQDYPANYLSFIPMETLTASNVIHSNFDGAGGWVYDESAGELSRMFYPNVPHGEELPYEPFQLQIEKENHSLRLVSGSQVIWEKQVGLGANGGTPNGSFTVNDRVLNPIGSKPKVYGVAGLGLGDIAIHGTYEESSIGQDVSLGCIRLKNSDIEELFAFVPKGTEVMIKERGGRVATKLVSAAESNRLIPAQLPIVDETPENHIFAWLG